MRELTQAETAAAMEKRKTDAMEQLRAEHKHLDVLDKAGKVPGIVKRRGSPTMGIGLGNPGNTLAKLIQKAAGLDGYLLRSIECRIGMKEPITFTAEILGTAEDIAAAIAANEEEG